MHRAYIRYLKKKGLPSGGSEEVLKARVEAYKKSKKAKKQAVNKRAVKRV